MSSEDPNLVLYIRHKREACLKAGRTERETEESIEAYLLWRRRQQEWEKSKVTTPRGKCPYCKKAPIRRDTPSGFTCRTCYMTRPSCLISGCIKLAVGKTLRCVDHQELTPFHEQGGDNVQQGGGNWETDTRRDPVPGMSREKSRGILEEAVHMRRVSEPSTDGGILQRTARAVMRCEEQLRDDTNE